jgi:predicted patatin/cPLA2 family phospholipase
VISVAELIRQRRREGSEPGRRTDRYRLALAIEGGGSRGAYSSGMVLTLEKSGLTGFFDDVYGSSMGAINAIWLLSGHAAEGIQYWWHPGVMPRVVRLGQLVRGKPAVDLEFLTDQVYQTWAGLDFPAVLGSPVRLHPIATDADTGGPHDLGPLLHDADSVKLAMRGSAGLPVLTGPLVRLGGHRLLDGGVAEPVPYRSAMRDGATHVLVLRTRRQDEAPKAPTRGEDVAVRAFLRRNAPAVVATWRARHDLRLADELRLGDGDPRFAQVRVPLGSPKVSRLETDGSALRRAVRIGEQAMNAYLGEVDGDATGSVTGS